jgi:F-type H+-transporting ATPase subunit gamma
MEEAARLKERISSMHDLRNVIHAIRGIAATRIQEAQAALEGIRKYAAIVEHAIAQAARLGGAIIDAPVEGSRDAADTLIVICAEHGFVGGYNEALLDRCRDLLDPGQQLGIVGRRGVASAAERGLPVAWETPGTTYIEGVTDVARRVWGYIAQSVRTEVVFARYRGSEGYSLQAQQVLPLDPSLLLGAEDGLPPLHHLPPEQLLQNLAQEYLFAELTRALMEALASENGARLATMQAADHNIGDKLETLQKQERIVRQESITIELLDVVAGVEAVNSNNVGRQEA